VTALVVTVWLAVGAYALARYQHLFREIVLRRPVVAFESDDWGPGPPEDALRLRELAACVSPYRDGRNRPTVITVGVVLAVADTPTVASQSESLQRLTLDSERCSQVRQALLEGEKQGAFVFQLHCAEHYWPPALLAVGRREDTVARWLSTPGIARTESLPSYLQSRWIDTSRLPSQPLAEPVIALAVDEEVQLFDRVFGKGPEVVVPPTFVWDERVERAWARRGIKVVITSGCRHEARDVHGRLEPPTKIIRNGERAFDKGPVYLVRDVYFEPALGHRAEDTIERIVDKARLGRPALIEMHRFNFVDDDDKANGSLAELRKLLEGALAALPDLRFVPPGELADAIVHGDSDLVETRFLGRLAVWLRRLWGERRIRWLAVGTGAIVPAAGLWAVASVLTGRLRGAALA
jgi:hypothetical protein